MNILLKSDRRKKPVSKMLSLYTYKKHNIVIIGKKTIRRKIQEIEEHFNVEIIFTNPKRVVDHISPSTIAIIIDEQEVKTNIKKYIENSLLEYSNIPHFYLSRTNKNTRFYGSLYEMGIQGIIDWPKEALVLHNLIIESFKPHPYTTGMTSGDEKLSDIIKSHLVLSGSYKGVAVKVVRGYAYLSGSVRSLYDINFIEAEVSSILGVQRAIVEDLRVRKKKNTTDREVERKIKLYISHVLGDYKRSILVKVEDKVVTLKGTVNLQGDLVDIEQFILKLPGVQRIIKNVLSTPSKTSENMKKAKSIEVKAAALFDGVKFITVNLYGDIVEVSGIVTFKKTRVLVEKYILQQLAVTKIINKIIVRPKR